MDVPLDRGEADTNANPAGVPYSFRSTARALASTRVQRTATASTYETGPRFTVTFAKKSRFTAWSSDGTQAQTLIDMDIAVAPR
ncbi:hypothetical protein AB0F46_20390 [Streptomyces sp. NPDC026665]|uniref:hypothetical protein n=1 Tax=Streptomyces sp. NPDC026665 TaxID=3154798 RepID=UPI0034061B1E